MNRQLRGVMALILFAASASCHDALSAEPSKVAWHTDIQSAWKAAQQQGRPLLVFVTRYNCFYCTQMKLRTYENLQIAGAINRSFVPLVIDGSVDSPLVRELKVQAFPATFVISPQAVILDRIDGYVPPEVLARRLSAKPTAPIMAKMTQGG